MSAKHSKTACRGGMRAVAVTALAVAMVVHMQAAERAPNVLTIRAAARKIESLQKPVPRPGPFDWLAGHPEPGQTFDAYIASNPNRPTRTRTTIYVLPLGDFSDAQQHLLDRALDLVARFYGVPVKALDRLDLNGIPEGARRVNRGSSQILTGFVLKDILPARRPKDAVATIALTTSDLWPGEGWNFVFGQASLTERVGVWSLARYGDPEKESSLVLRRTLNVATHELGHMFGILHCTAHACGMNGSNSLEESDRAPLPFCSECEQKIWWACAVDPVARYASLVEFAEANDLPREAAEWRARLSLLQSAR
jgi:archaemetzincin